MMGVKYNNNYQYLAEYVRLRVVGKEKFVNADLSSVISPMVFAYKQEPLRY
jgi:hypothetical protein